MSLTTINVYTGLSKGVGNDLIAYFGLEDMKDWTTEQLINHLSEKPFVPLSELNKDQLKLVRVGTSVINELNDIKIWDNKVGYYFDKNGNFLNLMMNRLNISSRTSYPIVVLYEN